MLTLLVADANIHCCEELEEYCANNSEINILSSVHNGADAIKAISEQGIDVLLMDFVIPVVDGFGVLNYINTLPEDRRPKVFINTAFFDNRLLRELQLLGVIYCFVKPMDAKSVITRIQHLLGIKHEPQSSLDNHEFSFLFNENELNSVTTKLIRAVGVQAHLKGYHYLRAAICFMVEADDPSAVALTKEIYPYIAKKYNTRPALVERSIRNAIEIAWARGNIKVLHEYFGYTINDYKGKPTNAEFISMMADRAKIQLSINLREKQ